MSEPNLQSYRHDQIGRLGVLIVNLGTPDGPDRASVRRYLKQFLWDPRVVEIARPIWWLVLNLVILNTRPGRSARAYQKVWTDDGSPLLVISRAQRDGLAKLLDGRHGGDVPVVLGMRYGNPSIPSALKQMRQAGVRRLLVLPLYPQYSATSTASVFDAVTSELQRWRWLPELRFINHYHDDAAYIGALAGSVKRYRRSHGEAEMLLMSFHGIPEECLHQGDPYFCECHKTARLLADVLGLGPEQWQLSFQSRLGPRQWLQPYTDHSLKAMAGRGIKSVQVICPGFAADCLETLEEIALEDRDIFLDAGGEHYQAIPCLNDDPGHILMLAALVERHTRAWAPLEADHQQTHTRALALGARH